MVGSELQTVQSHIVEVALPLNYPRTPPLCRMLSPVFHPNIAPHAICVGDHWGAGESLESIVIRIGEMLAYQSYNVKSPLNGEAARWVEQNKHRLPLDPVSMLPEEERQDSSAEATLGESEKPRQFITGSPGSPSATKCEQHWRAAISWNGIRRQCAAIVEHPDYVPGVWGALPPFHRTGSTQCALQEVRTDIQM